VAKILIVDDEKDLTDMLVLRLRKQGGHDAIAAYDGDEALQLAGEQRPDLIVLDLVMPKKSGYEVAQILKQQESTKNIPLIILTASAGPATNDAIVKLGVAGYITKPFAAPELMAEIDKVLRGGKR
jgi:DNA-binding response OmpR family regulator